MGLAIWALRVCPVYLYVYLTSPTFIKWASNSSCFLFAAQVALGSIFKKRETAASQAVVTEVPREKKSRKRGKSPVIEKVPAFLTPREVTVEEDSSPYVVEWGLLKKDTVVGDSRAAAEWSRNVITPRDRAHVVESSEDLQIELLGAQAVATVSPKLTYCLVFESSSYLGNFSSSNCNILCRSIPTSRLRFTT